MQTVDTETLVGIIKFRMESMTGEQRMKIIGRLLDGYCKECGCDDPRCQCWNDE